MMMWERWEVSSVGVRRHQRTRRRREDRPATVSQKPAVREHEPGPCLQRDLGHRHHHLPPRSVPQVQWVSLSSPLQTCWSTPGRSASGWRRSRTCSVWPRRLWIQNYRIVGSLGEAIGNLLSTCERLLLVRMSTFQLKLNSHVWLTVEDLSCQFVRGARGVVLLQHQVRDQPVGAPSGRLVQTDGRHAQAGQEGGRSVNSPTSRLQELWQKYRLLRHCRPITKLINL